MSNKQNKDPIALIERPLRIEKDKDQFVLVSADPLRRLLISTKDLRDMGNQLYPVEVAHSLLKGLADGFNEAPALEDRIRELEGSKDNLQQEAEIHAQEARAYTSTVNEILQLVSGATGEKGNWNAVSAVRERLAELEEENEMLTAQIQEMILLTHLQEESAEISQRVSKAIRFGLDEIQPGQELNNRERSEEEVNDFGGTLAFLHKQGILLMLDRDWETR